MKIGVFDTGKGGEIVAERLANIFPEHEFITADDLENAPYGSKTPAQIRQLVAAAIKPLLPAQIIVVACNTATTIAINHLRAIYPKHEFIGFEPALKPALRFTATGNIMVLATPATLASRRYQQLKNRFAEGKNVIEPDCSPWAWRIENNKFRPSEFNLTPTVKLATDQKVDQIVLGCTHFLSLQERLQKLLPEVKIQEPTPAVAEQISRYLATLPR